MEPITYTLHFASHFSPNRRKDFVNIGKGHWV